MFSLEADWQIVCTSYRAEATIIIFSWHWLLWPCCHAFLCTGLPAGHKDPPFHSSWIHRSSFRKYTPQASKHRKLPSEGTFSLMNTHKPASPCLHIWMGACCPGSSGAVSSALPGTSPNSPLCSCAPSGTSSEQPEGGSTESARTQQCRIFQHSHIIFYTEKHSFSSCHN